jgi:beta-lactamase class A
MRPKRLFGLAVVTAAILSLRNTVASVSDPTPSAGVRNDSARIGVALLDLDGQSRKVLHADERFAMCSMFKFLAVAAVLRRVDYEKDKLDRFIKYSERDILGWAPVTKRHLGEGGMTLEALCFAAIAYSDNTAANLLLDVLGGPAGLTAYARSLGDDITRLDRIEPELNNVARDEARDTTSPMAMLHDMQKILLGDALSVSMREKLESWMIQNTTGNDMIRAGVPPDWRVGDKTGQNQTRNSNDIAIIRRPDGRAVLLCIYVDAPGEPMHQRAKMIADVTRDLIGRDVESLKR